MTAGFTLDPNDYPVLIYNGDGEFVDAAGNAETIDSILYGDLSYHPGMARIVQIPANMTDLIGHVEYLAAINADCFGIPLDHVEPVLGWFGAVVR